MTGGAVRVLHVVGAMNRGGVETWLMHVLRRFDRADVAMDFLVHTEEPAAFDAEIVRRGGEILRCPETHRPWRYARRFRELLREHGPYDVVHSHVHRFSGWVLRAAAAEGVPMRVAHSHVDTRPLERRRGPFRAGYRVLGSLAIRRWSTDRLACSRPAGDDLFRGVGGRTWETLPYGIDLSPFSDEVDRERARRSLGLRRDALVAVHVGRFHPQKNHAFLVGLLRELRARGADAQLVLVGDGPLRGTIEAHVTASGLGAFCTFAGLRDDVPWLMAGVADVVVMPSITEGLPLVAIEAQAAGRPTLLSDVITTEVDALPGLVQRLPLAAGPGAWADAVIAMKNAALPPVQAVGAIAGGPLDIATSAAKLARLYRSRCGRGQLDPAWRGIDRPL